MVGKVLGGGDCNSWLGGVTDGTLGGDIFNEIVEQIQELKSSPMEWSIILLLVFSVRLGPHEGVTWGMTFVFMEEGAWPKMAG